MLQRPHRLRRSADFAHLREVGQSHRHPLLMLGVAANDLGYNRYGFIVAKQIGGAVQRNRVRRRLREIVRHVHPTLTPGYDLVWVARNQIGRQSYTQIGDAVTQLLHRARLFKGE